MLKTEIPKDGQTVHRLVRKDACRAVCVCAVTACRAVAKTVLAFLDLVLIIAGVCAAAVLVMASVIAYLCVRRKKIGKYVTTPKRAGVR